MQGDLDRERYDGDFRFELRGDTLSRMTVDRERYDGDASIELETASKTGRVRVDRERYDGDESIDGDIKARLDRERYDGDFTLQGDGFLLEGDRERYDGDLKLDGQLPQDLAWYPLLHTVFGPGTNDDEDSPDAQPFNTGTLLAMSRTMHDAGFQIS